MTLADLTSLLSRVSKDHPALLESREVALFIEACIERQRRDDGMVADELPPISPTTIDASLVSNEPDTGRSR